MKILIVDDDKMILEAISHYLTAEGHEVITAMNGLQALELAQSKRLDLIISDIMMPDLSGLSMLSMLKQFYFNKIPVIFISSLDKSDVILSSLGLGADDFMAKPINFKELSIRVQKYVKKPATQITPSK
jgi:DNA-binding response OmpR family regulator